jgi:hypothetical protein
MLWRICERGSFTLVSRRTGNIASGCGKQWILNSTKPLSPATFPTHPFTKPQLPERPRSTRSTYLNHDIKKQSISSDNIMNISSKRSLFHRHFGHSQAHFPNPIPSLACMQRTSIASLRHSPSNSPSHQKRIRQTNPVAGHPH